jgi:DNA replication protein DnaC
MESLGSLLAQVGLPPAPAPAVPLATPPLCGRCHGAGYLRLEALVGQPDFGRLVPCGCQPAGGDPAPHPALPGDALGAFAEQTFATFDPTVPGTAAAFATCQAYAKDLGGWLVLQGGWGSGKTHLAAAVAHAAQAQGMTTYFAVAPDLLDHLRATYAPSSPVSYDALFEGIRTVEILVVDDLGAEAPTPWAAEKLYQLLNHRYIYRLPTVVTTNRTLDQLEGRLASRLGDRCLCRHVRLTAADYRRR